MDPEERLLSGLRSSLFLLLQRFLEKEVEGRRRAVKRRNGQILEGISSSFSVLRNSL